MKNNKKGFTLVELLAVIVILGVLLLIAVPAVTNIINTSKKNAFEKQAMLALENVETMISVQSPGTISSDCLIKLSDIELERGSWNGYTGKVAVTAAGVATISMSDGTHSVEGKKLREIPGNIKTGSSYAAQADAASTTCAWWD